MSTYSVPITLQAQQHLQPHLRLGLVDIPGEAQHLPRMQQKWLTATMAG